MRTRDKKISDYGIQEEDKNRLLMFCKKANTDDRILLLQCAISAAPGLEVSIYDSLVNGVGYDTIYRHRHIPAKKDDFYGYRRKTLAEYYRMLCLLGRWK